VPIAEAPTKFLNFVVYASQPIPTGSMSVPAASLSYSRVQPTAPLDEGFEDGLDSDGIDSVFEYEFNGTLSASTDQAREGTKSLLVDLDLSVDEPGDGDIRRNEVRPPDQWSTGGHIGEERWYGFSVYFPEEFQVPRPDPFVYFDGVIDEVRLYDQILSNAQIESDMAGEYSQNPTPVAAYNFDQGSGPTASDSAGNHDGAIIGATWTSSGQIGSALDFDGGDEVSIPDSAQLDFTSSFTLEAWVRPDSLSGALGSPVISKVEAPESTASGYLMRAAAIGSRPDGVVAASGTVAKASGSGTLPLEEWSHLALTSDGSTLRLYVDGQLVKEAAAVSALPTSTPLTIGSSNYSMAKAGTWNIFTQFRHTHDGNLGCAEDPGGVPITFNSRYYKAGAHTNPGASETATPTDDDYIEIGLNGGKVTADCSDTVKSPERYVLTQLQRNRWYDFVLHTRWTTDEGGPGNSISEVWMDGEQVLGDQSTPISRPTLSWRLSPDQHNTGVTRQFGLYRGPSSEDPLSQLYIDAVKSGDLYSEVAPGQ
jgi:hypothetical protein